MSGIPGHPLDSRVMDGLAEEIGDHVHLRPRRVQEIMTPAVVSIPEDATAVQAAARMVQLGVHRLLVVRGDELVGVVSTIDSLRAFVQLHA